MAYELTPRFPSHPSVVDLCSGEHIAEGVWGEWYLVRKRQEIIIVIEELDGPRVVLREGVIGESFDSVMNPHTLIAILRNA